MPHLSTKSRKPAAAALTILLVACFALAACGGSSGSSSSSTPTAANAAATGTGATSTPAGTTPSGTSSNGTTSSATTPSKTTPSGTSSTGTSATTPTVPGRRPNAGRFAAIRTCLQKDGITLPTPGTAGVRSGPQLPKGMTRTEYFEDLKKCGGNFGGLGAFKGGRSFNSPRFRQALTKFAACLRQNGVNLPPPNTSGKGPVFSTKGINTSSPQFKAAEIKCRSTLLGGLRSGTAAPGASPGIAG
jgi:hypothetical protein